MITKTSSVGIDVISRWEGLRLTAYKDIVGKLTIGYGHLIKPGENYEIISKDKAIELLKQDVQYCETEIVKQFGDVLTQNQFDALVSFGFNCGTGVYKKSSVADAIKSNRFEDVPAGLFLWCKAGGVPVEGLLDRREHEASIFSEMSQTSRYLKKSELIQIQTKLKNLNLYTKAIDGKWGPGTEFAIKTFLMQNGITYPMRPINQRIASDVIRFILE